LKYLEFWGRFWFVRSLKEPAVFVKEPAKNYHWFLTNSKLVDWIECYYQCHQNPPQIPSSSFTIVQEKVATLLRHAQQAVFLSFFAI
jgi:hypothetical protein